MGGDRWRVSGAPAARLRGRGRRGIVEVVRHLPAIRRAMEPAHARSDRGGFLRSVRPDRLPDFNFRLAVRARSASVPIVYYVSPQVWAWCKGRVATLRRLVRRVLVLFPFEAPFYETAGCPRRSSASGRGPHERAFALGPPGARLRREPSGRRPPSGELPWEVSGILPVPWTAGRVFRRCGRTQLVVPSRDPPGGFRGGKRWWAGSKASGVRATPT